VTPKAIMVEGKEGGDTIAHNNIDFNPFKWEDVLQTAVDMACQNYGQLMPVIMETMNMTYIKRQTSIVCWELRNLFERSNLKRMAC
jgi:hypothetical protein